MLSLNQYLHGSCSHKMFIVCRHVLISGFSVLYYYSTPLLTYKTTENFIVTLVILHRYIKGRLSQTKYNYDRICIPTSSLVQRLLKFFSATKLLSYSEWFIVCQ